MARKRPLRYRGIRFSETALRRWRRVWAAIGVVLLCAYGIMRASDRADDLPWLLVVAVGVLWAAGVLLTISAFRRAER